MSAAPATIAASASGEVHRAPSVAGALRAAGGLFRDAFCVRGVACLYTLGRPASMRTRAVAWRAALCQFRDRR